MKYWYKRTHGMSQTRIYHAWFNMKTRCLDEKCERYKDYGGRGIKICARWMKFENFFADMGHPPKNHTLEREDNNGNYEPNNCVWATMRTQTRNRKSNVIITFQGETMCLKDWAARLGIFYQTLCQRHKAGWAIEELFAPPGSIKNSARKNNLIITFNGESMCLSAWAEKLDVPYFTLWMRHKRGWDTERMLTQRTKSG